MAVDTSIQLRNQVLYSVYVRNYSQAGTFQAVEQDLDRIQSLGVDIIWFLPIYPIGVAQRKGTLGSPYAISNYREVNPELGTKDDFVHLVDAIHARGMKCILDIVYNHTSPDSWLAAHHPKYFYRTPEGTMGNRVGDWSDIVDLDYANRELWAYQIDTLKMWAQIVDGFRCDVAPLVPLDFWLQARREVAKVRPGCIWLSESVEPEFTVTMRANGMESLSDGELYQAYDMTYDYDAYPFFRGYLSGKSSLEQYVAYLNMQEYLYPGNYVKLRFLENHDQDRAASVIRTEDALINWTAFSYFQKGTTMVYAGQENRNTNRPSLFEKDVICLDGKQDISDLLVRLGRVKKLPLMADSSYHLTADVPLGAIVGEHRGVHTDDRLVGVFSLEGKQGAVKVGLQDGVYQNLVTGADVEVKDGKIVLAACPVIIHTDKE